MQSSASLQLTPPVNFVIKVLKPDNISWLNVNRQKFFTRIHYIVDPSRLDIASPCDVTQLILDSSVFFKSKTIIDSCELYSREPISSLHQTRNKLLSSNEKQQSLAVSNLNLKSSRANFSRHQKRRIVAKKSTSTRRFAVK